jgi:hypothetical protein
VTSGFRHDVHQIRTIRGYYTVSSGNPVSTFRGKLSAPSSKVKKSKKKAGEEEEEEEEEDRLLGVSLPLKMGPVGRPETSVRNYHSTLRKIAEQRKSPDKRRIGRVSNREFSTTWLCSVFIHVLFYVYL